MYILHLALKMCPFKSFLKVSKDKALTTLGRRSFHTWCIRITLTEKWHDPSRTRLSSSCQMYGLLASRLDSFLLRNGKLRINFSMKSYLHQSSSIQRLLFGKYIYFILCGKSAWIHGARWWSKHNHMLVDNKEDPNVSNSNLAIILSDVPSSSTRG